MYNEWSLHAFYNGIHDPELEKDISRLEAVIREFRSAVASLSKEDARGCLRRTVEI